MHDTVIVPSIPFSLETVEEDRKYCSQNFVVSSQSHEKAVSLLIRSLDRKPRNPNPYPFLLPSELWGMARAFSPRFGRLNEVGLARAVWRVWNSVAPASPLRADAIVTAKFPKGRLALCATQTATFDIEGRLLMRADDTILIIHDCAKPFFVEPTPVRPVMPSTILYRNRHTVYFRYEWDSATWINNIHVDDYAQSCGFERGLPEFIIYMDWIYHAAIECGWIPCNGAFSISLRKILPLYHGEIVDIFACAHNGCLHVYLCKDGLQRIVATLASM
jgi:hypothetical protein